MIYERGAAAGTGAAVIDLTQAQQTGRGRRNSKPCARQWLAQSRVLP
jgi:hypothetical protein